MFQPETEDMLPRAAPMPSANLGSNHASIKPMVPEVSILFGQQGAGAGANTAAAATQMPAVAQQTYAAWKKKVLPKVTYPPELRSSNSGTPTSSNHSPTAEYVVAPRSNIYPLRIATPAVSPLVTTSSSAESLQYQRRSAEITTPIYATHDHVVANSNAAYQQQRRSLDTVSQRTYTPSRDDVLTICAGTQTVSSPDATIQSPRNFASKQDVEQLLAMLQEMRAEQLRLTQICEALLVRQRDDEDLPRKTFLRDIGTQCEIGASNFVTVAAAAAAARRPIMHEYIDEEEVPCQQRQQQQQATPSNAYHNQLIQQAQPPQFKSPRTTPVAQSTAYRAITPRQQRPVFVAQHQQQQQQQQHNPTKPMTEQSMVMNELALKYLPNEKIGELLQDFHISPQAAETGAQQQQQQQTATPLRQVENFEKSPNDISNASYKYLKKYRLLPEENGADYRQTSPRMQSPAALVRQQQQSPYQQFGSTPLNMGGGGDGRVQEPLLDLEHLRNQPKFV